MTFEEMQAVIAGMLEVQRNLQESQLRDRQDILLLIEQTKQLSSVQRSIQEDQIRDRQDIELLIERGKQQEKIVDRLIGYSLAYESDKLDLEQRMTELERKRAERDR
ncbi:MAG: hypothetical protein AUK48_15665 [Oscillatoriales cyanobacterium CG2_30_44_21]|nr:MAG: hypothetical protein AUK48_15665 [Oscillatoriales cyanobacterium CG2_30_44_21]